MSKVSRGKKGVVQQVTQGYAVVMIDKPRVYLDLIRSTKGAARNAYLNGCDNGWTWKRLYGIGARVKRVLVKITVQP